jgi:hypothetical protein
MATKKRCKRMKTKKYLTRNSPPYPANKCLREIKKGNDGRMYVSKGNVNNVYRWVLV